MNANLVIHLEDATPESLIALQSVLITYNLTRASRIEGYSDQNCTFDYCEHLATALDVANDFFDLME